MKILATEFPVSALNTKAALVAEVTAWLRGMERSTVLDDHEFSELEKDYVNISSSSGESIQFRSLQNSEIVKAVGFRHEIPDGDFSWRTEGVLDFESENPLFRIRTQCIAHKNSIETRTPHKSYIIKTIIREGKAGKDGRFDVVSSPIKIIGDNLNESWLSDALSGRLSEFLPIILMTANEKWNSVINQKILNSLAFNVGGIAHVVQIQEKALKSMIKKLGTNFDLDAQRIAIIAPEAGLKSIFYLGGRFPTQIALADAVESRVKSIRSQMPIRGLDWADIQERAFSEYRASDKKKLSFEDLEALFRDEMALKDERIAEKESELRGKDEEIQSLSQALGGISNYDDRICSQDSEVIWRNFQEIYAGESRDRIIFILREAMLRAEIQGLDQRTIAFVEHILAKVKPSEALRQLRLELKEATKNPKQFSTRLTATLSRYGYSHKSDNGHARLEPHEGLFGVSSITLANTPSDGRGMKNACQQIEASMGITKL